jgi:hypothetical protein
MTDELYLILHKVRGESACDVAQKLMIGDEEGWIIPTSGHRAYPFSVAPILTNDRDDIALGSVEAIAEDWNSLPDHYQVAKASPPPKLNVRSLLAGLRPAFNFKRRV